LAEPAPLRATLAAPAPAGGAAEWYTGAGGARLRAALFPSKSAPRGAVVVSPGRTEPIEKYFETVETLTARGFAVLVHDWRGQGLSHRLLADRLLGHARGSEDFLGDYSALLAVFESRLPMPWIALGHSMGGCLTLLALACGQKGFSAAILSAPMLGINTGKAPLSVVRTLATVLTTAGRGGSPVFKSPNSQTFEGNILTHDRERWERYEALIAAWPELALGDPTWGWLSFALSATRTLQIGPGVPRIDIPVTVVVAGEERLVDNAGARRIAGRLRDGRLVEIPGARHELLQETDAVRAAFWRAFDDLAERVAAGPVEASRRD
jgi:lysophospholipase